jgi:chromosome segregation ATPase
MGEDEFGSPGFAKSVRSLLDALSTLEREAEIMFERASAGSAAGLTGVLGAFAQALARSATGSVSFAGLLRRAGAFDPANLSRILIQALGIADEASIAAVRDEVRDVVEQVARLRERELALAGGVSQLRARSARFEEALAGLARVQGKCVARLDGQVERAHKLEQLAGRRDDHITRLIRDTAGQRAELERLAREIDTVRSERAEQRKSEADEVVEIRAKVGQIESQYADLKKLQTGATQRVIETLESMRDRVGKLEARAAEMSREARAKAGRLDALARHVATVEGRLSSAIGKPGDTVVAVAKDIERPMSAAG